MGTPLWVSGTRELIQPGVLRSLLFSRVLPLPPSRLHLHPNPTAASGFLGQVTGTLPTPRTGDPGGSGPAGTPRSRTSVLYPQQEQDMQTTRHQSVLMLFFSEVETIQEHGKNDQNVCVYKTLFRPMPLPRNGQEPGGARAGGGRLCTAGGTGPQTTPRKVWAGPAAPSTVTRGDAHPLCRPLSATSAAS